VVFEIGFGGFYVGRHRFVCFCLCLEEEEESEKLVHVIGWMGKWCDAYMFLG